MTVRKVALITGITGQDGAYLSELLLNKGYEVHGLLRRSASDNTERLQGHLKDRINQVRFHFGDLTDTTSILGVLQKVKPAEIYNLGAQSHVGVSFEVPEYTADCDGLGTLRLLESLRVLGLIQSTKFYQASTSELFGMTNVVPQNEKTAFYPRSPYAAAKLYAYWITVNYREAYGLFACNGILFNHESPLRDETFVTRKITKSLCRIKLRLQEKLNVGNLYAKRDWGHAQDYVEMQWLMLQQPKPQDFVIATGRQHTVKEFIEQAAANLQMELKWSGDGTSETASWNGQVVVGVDQKFLRPTEVENIVGDASKAHRELNWKPKLSFSDLVREMVEVDLAAAKLESKRSSELSSSQ